MKGLVSRRDAVIAGALGALALGSSAFAQKEEKEMGTKKESVEALKALLDEHHRAFSEHDMDGILKLFAANAAILGTGPGEIWVGTEEITEAYKHFFEGFDKGKQEVEVLWKDGGVGADLAWLMAVTKVTMTKGANKTESGIHLSITFEKKDGDWKARAFHFSNLTGNAKPAAGSETKKEA